MDIAEEQTLLEGIFRMNARTYILVGEYMWLLSFCVELGSSVELPVLSRSSRKFYLSDRTTTGSVFPM